MDTIIKTTIDAYMATFDSFAMDDDSKTEVEEFKTTVYSMGENCKNAEDFISRFTTEGYQDKYTALMGKIYMKQNQPEATQNSDEVPDVMSVKDYVEQYRISYDDIKKCGYRKRAEIAYETLFDVANRTDDMLDAQLIMEDERLLFKIVTEDLMDIAEDLIAATDPNYLVTHMPLKVQLESYLNVSSDEELTYKTEVAQVKKESVKYQHTSQMTAILSLNYLVLKWVKCKMSIRKWADDRSIKRAIGEMLRIRYTTRAYYDFISSSIGLTLDVMESTPFYRICLLTPTGLDEMARIKMVQNPENLSAIKTILADEILSETDLGELLTKPQSVPYYFSLNKRKNSVQKMFEEKASQINWESFKFCVNCKN